MVESNARLEMDSLLPDRPARSGTNVYAKITAKS